MVLIDEKAMAFIGIAYRNICVALLVGANGLGCSEYTDYRSSACIQLEELLGTDLYWPSTIVGLIAFPISLIATPIFLVYVFKAFF